MTKENKFKCGDHVYFHSDRHGTIPAIIMRVGKTHAKRWTKFRGMLLIKGNYPNGDRTSWVNANNCEKQLNQEPAADLRKICSGDIIKGIETELVFYCSMAFCGKSISDDDIQSLRDRMNEIGWRFGFINREIGTFCPDCIKAVKEDQSDEN